MKNSIYKVLQIMITCPLIEDSLFKHKYSDCKSKECKSHTSEMNYKVEWRYNNRYSV